MVDQIVLIANPRIKPALVVPHVLSPGKPLARSYSLDHRIDVFSPSEPEPSIRQLKSGDTDQPYIRCLRRLVLFLKHFGRIVHSAGQLEGTENSIFLDLLRIFAHGTWSEYKSVSSHLPQLLPDQVLKLKKLTVLTLAETNKVLPYDTLMQELDITNDRELEDFLINDCMYVGIVRGKLDQLRRCFEVQFSAGKDLRPGQLSNMIQMLANWLSASENLLISIQEKIKWADTMNEIDQKHRKEVDDRVEEAKKALFLKADNEFRGHEEIFSEHGGVMDFEEDRSRPKRRRQPING